MNHVGRAGVVPTWDQGLGLFGRPLPCWVSVLPGYLDLSWQNCLREVHNAEV